MNAQLEKADKQLHTVEELVKKIREQDSNDSNSSTIIGDLLNEGFTGLATSNLAIRAAEDLNSRETLMEKRQAIKQRLKALRTQHERLKEMLLDFKKEARRAEQVNVRTSLLGRPGSTAISSGLDDRPTSVSVVTAEAYAEREGRVLNHAEGRLGEYISMGTSTLESLRAQRSIMKGAQRRVLDVGSRLGISQSVMRVISRRTAQDRYIFYAGSILIFLTIYLCWKYI